MVFNDCLRRSIHRAQREGRQVGLMFIDLDRFKAINDSLGHAAGDTLLKHLSTRLKGCVRENDTIARLGGDEFAVILENIAHHKDAAISASRLVEACLEPAFHGADKIFSSASIGIALYPSDASTTEELLRHADLAMYQAKESGGNGFRFYADAATQRAAETGLQAYAE
jgi:diguanylate cyclase (GGDEF)-like protein